MKDGLYLICYDVADTRRRTRLHKLLLAHGDPVEESVFEARLSSKALRALRADIHRIADRDADIVRIYALCRECERRVIVVVGPPSRERPAAHVL